jgi:regulation of enolase protein 1 (concanavalin A-like superfamily)
VLAGGQSVDGSLWTVWGAGHDIWHRQDRFHFLWQPRSGDISLSARVIAQTATHPWAKAGLMIRANTAPSAPNIGIFVTPARGVVVQYRAAPGAPALLARWVFRFATPLYLRLDRRGATFTAAVSRDDANWTVLARLQLPAIGSDALAGLAVTSHQPAALSRVVFDGVSIGP